MNETLKTIETLGELEKTLAKKEAKELGRKIEEEEKGL